MKREIVLSTKKTLLSLVLAAMALAPLAHAADQNNLNFWGAAPQPSAATNLAFAIISAKGNDGRKNPWNKSVGQPVVHFLRATSDLATAVCKVYSSGAPVKITAASGGSTNVVGVSAADATTFTTTNRVLILRHVASDTYERLVNLTPTGNTIKFAIATETAVAKDDLIYVCTAVGPGLLVGAAQKEYNIPDGIFTGDAGRPLLFEVNATTLAKIEAYAGKFRFEE